MFDIGFSELVVVGLVALIVIGPERLPKVARTLGHLFGRMQRYVNDVKADISREMELEELKKIQTTFQDAAKSVEESVSQVNQEIQATEQALNDGISGTPAADPPAVSTAAADAAASEPERPAAEVPATEGPAAQAAEAAQMDLALDPRPADTPEDVQGTQPASAPKA
jgi:sec-independent protein translocase protein TatB